MQDRIRPSQLRLRLIVSARRKRLNGLFARGTRPRRVPAPLTRSQRQAHPYFF